jgi:uncharacterized protein (TIGR02145 family)
MRKSILLFSAAALLGVGLQAQVCDPTVAPTGLVSTYTPGSGALLEWNPVPGSVGVQLRVDLPSGPTINRRIVGPEVDQFFAPDALLSPGTYTWRVQAACSAVPPFAVTPISASSSFTVGGGGSCPATVTDIDGNVYATVQIGSQCWMAENLKVERYRNGDFIPAGLSNSGWSSTSSGTSAVYSNNPANKATYGLLYNWYAVDDARGLCPSGWHVPTDEEWTTLTGFLGGESVAGGGLKTAGTLSEGTGLWFDPNTGATNSSGFSALPGGFRSSGGSYGEINYDGYWWTNTEIPTIGASWLRALYAVLDDVYRYEQDKVCGLSVRCIRD